MFMRKVLGIGKARRLQASLMGKGLPGAHAKKSPLLEPPDKDFKEAIATTPIATAPKEIMENKLL